MTSSPEPADDGKTSHEPSPAENLPQADKPSESTQPADGSTISLPMKEGTAVEATQPTAEEGLPEWEPLTPELVEDEAIRGDFVIRWAVVGLALLFGFSQINETRTLIHIRSGEYLASHGILPPATDVFASTTEGRRWVNLPWLFDLVAAGVHQVGGGIGLTVFQGILAGIAFGLLAHTCKTGIRTWWGSICATLALLACYPQLTVQPELMTLVGMAALLWIIVQAQHESPARTLWLSVPLIWIWAQFDQRAFLGWGLLIVMALGEAMRKGDDSSSRRRLWFQVALASLAVVVIHPFLWESWLAPLRLYLTDYPALRQIFARPVHQEIAFYPITAPYLWSSINHQTVAALVLFAATIVTMILNRERLHAGHLLAVVLFNTVACLATHEFAAASLVNCMVCTINAQDWYRHRFGQVYSVDWRELLFSRGGRAVTVICLFSLAWFVISGRVDGPSGKRTGLGFDSNLLVQMDCYKQIAARSYDDRPFHFAARQGDLVIWTGQKSFIDSRAGLFKGRGEQDILALHDQTRKAIRAVHEIPTSENGKGNQNPTNATVSSNPEFWKKVFAQYQVTHAMPRLSGPVPPPDYITFNDLMLNRNWVLTDIGASTAVFYASTSEGPVAEYIEKMRLDPIKLAFRQRSTSDDAELETLRESARPQTSYDQMFSIRQPNYPAGVQEAGHYLQLASITQSPSVAAAYAVLGLRRATAGLRQDSNSAEGYRMLGLAHLLLDRFEASVMKETGIQWYSANHNFQAIAAYQQAAHLKPADLGIQSELLSLHERTRRTELALEDIRQMLRLRPPPASPEQRKQWEPLINRQFELDGAVSQIENGVNQQLENGADRYQVAAAAYQAGAVRTAVKVLEDEAIYIEQNPAAKNALGAWLIEVGRIQDGLDKLEAVEQAASVGGGSVPGWRDSVANGFLVNGDYKRSIRLWNDELREEVTNSTNAALMTLPLESMNPLSDQYPLTHTAAVSEIIGRTRGTTTSLMFRVAMAELEMNRNEVCAASLQKALESDPNTPMRPLLKFYLELLTDQKIEAKPPAAPIIEEFEPLTEKSK